ncbi:RDD family protein [Demequina sediminicola]|uniref:RDD family protein n=1 Tax=Demequina sediminicola TaxID=1095026 RepID=UPI000783F6DA|nr:RDD family protein [Demequina sediminicola]
MTDERDPETEEGPKTYAGRRLSGIALDWTLCLLISSAFFAQPAYENTSGLERVLVAGSPTATLAIWAVQHWILVGTLGTTIGHRLVGVRVVRDDGASMVGLIKSAGRTVLLGLVIPAVVWGPDGRGLHDRAVGTHIVSTRRD